MIASVVPTFTTVAQKKTAKKNILFIAVDDLKPLLGCYGDKLAVTPNIDRLAARGTIFTSSYCQQAVSGPTRASLLTGTCPDRTQVWDLQTLIRDKNPNAVTLPQYLAANGFETTGIGKIFDPRSVDKKLDEVSWSTPYISFEEYYNSEYGKPVLSQYQDPKVKEIVKQIEEKAKAQGIKKNKFDAFAEETIKPSTECLEVPDDVYNDGAIVKGAIEMLNNYKGTKPLFLAVGFKHPHLPFTAPKRYWDLYKRDQMPLAKFTLPAAGSPDFAYHNSSELYKYTDIPPVSSYSDIKTLQVKDDKVRELIHGYYASISYMDAQVGKLLEALDKKGMRENTIIVLWGDHGWHLGDHGLWNKHTNFEQATHAPLMIIDPNIKPSKVDKPVEFLDIFPTLCQLSGIKTPANLDGTSLVNLMKTPTAKFSKTYAASQFPRGPRMGYSIRDSRYRYTVWVEWKDRNLDAKKILAEELYDYEKDPLETVNQIKNKSYSAALTQMKAYWADYSKKRIQTSVVIDPKANVGANKVKKTKVEDADNEN